MQAYTLPPISLAEAVNDGLHTQPVRLKSHYNEQGQPQPSAHLCVAEGLQDCLAQVLAT